MITIAQNKVRRVPGTNNILTLHLDADALAQLGSLLAGARNFGEASSLPWCKIGPYILICIEAGRKY